jgi:predicted  nucleic acid-binding Zn-ribbon protein
LARNPIGLTRRDLEELKLNVEKLSDDLRTAEERIRKLEEELSLTRRDIAALTSPKATELPEDTELKEWQALRDTFKASHLRQRGGSPVGRAPEETYLNRGVLGARFGLPC